METRLTTVHQTLSGVRTLKITNTLLQAEKIRKLHKEGTTQTAIAEIFNTTQATVNNIVLGKTYIKEAV